MQRMASSKAGIKSKAPVLATTANRASGDISNLSPSYPLKPYQNTGRLSLEKLVILGWLRDMKESGAILRFMAYWRLETAIGRESVKYVDLPLTFVRNLLIGQVK